MRARLGWGTRPRSWRCPETNSQSRRRPRWQQRWRDQRSAKQSALARRRQRAAVPSSRQRRLETRRRSGINQPRCSRSGGSAGGARLGVAVRTPRRRGCRRRCPIWTQQPATATTRRLKEHSRSKHRRHALERRPVNGGHGSVGITEIRVRVWVRSPVSWGNSRTQVGFVSVVCHGCVRVRTRTLLGFGRSCRT